MSTGNFNYYVLAVLPPSTLLFLFRVRIFSLWRLLVLSLGLQLVVSVLMNAMEFNATATGAAAVQPEVPRAVALALQVLAHAVVEPLATICFFSFVLKNPRAYKVLQIHSVLENPQAEATPSFFVARAVMRWVNALRGYVEPLGPAAMVTVPWFYTYLFLHYWSSWYSNMKAGGDLLVVWSAGYILFFQFMKSFAIARRLSSSGSSGRRSCYPPLVLVVVLTAGIVLASYQQLLAPGREVNVQQLVSVLWSVA